MKLLTFPLLFLFLLSLAGCPGTTGDDDDSVAGTPSSTAPQSALSIEFSNLSLTHTYGQSPCPQPFGTVLITNSTDTDADYTVADSGTLTVLSSGAGTIPAGESVTVEVSFNCGDCPGAAGYSSTLTVNVGNGAKTNEQTANISGTFNGCP